MKWQDEMEYIYIYIYIYILYIYIFYQYIVTHTFKQHKNLSTRCKYIGSTWEKHKNKLLIKKLTKNN